jgi:hypothetical protein
MTQGRIQDFKLGGGALKKIVLFSVKNHIFSNFFTIWSDELDHSTRYKNKYIYIYIGMYINLCKKIYKNIENKIRFCHSVCMLLDTF